MAPRNSVAKINGLPIRNLRKPIILEITEEDCKRGSKKNPKTCAAALAAKRIPSVSEAMIHLNRVFLRVGNKWLRGTTPAALRTEVVAFDRGGRFEPGEYKIRPLSKSHAPTGQATGGTKNKNKSRTTAYRAKHKRPKVKIVGGVRSNAHKAYSYS